STDYSKSLQPDALKGARIGVARRRYFGYSDVTDRLIDRAIDAMKARGAVIVDPANIATGSRLESCEMEVLLFEFKADLNKYLATLRPEIHVRSLQDVIEFNVREAARELPYFGQELLASAQKKGALSSRAYRQALTTCGTLSRTQGIDRTMRLHRL